MAPERRRGQSRQGKGGGPTSSSQAQDDSKEAEQGPPQQQPAPETSEDGARRPKRKKISPEQLEVLMGTFEQDRTPDLQIRQRLAAQLGLTNREVQVWFQNKRSALRRKEQAASSAASSSSGQAPPTVKSEAGGGTDRRDYEGPVEWREPASYPSSLAATAPQAGMSSQSSRPPTGSYEHPPPLLAGTMPLASPEPMAAGARMPIAGSSQQRQSLPPLTSLSRPSSSAAGQERLQHLSSLSSISDPIQFTRVLSPEPTPALERTSIPYVSSGSSARGSSSSSSLLSGSRAGSGQFAEDPPPLPAPETNHLRLASTSGFAPEKPELPPPATMVQTAEPSSSAGRPGILPPTATARPWTGDGTTPGSDSWGQTGQQRAEPGERDYWTRRSQ